MLNRELAMEMFFPPIEIGGTRTILVFCFAIRVKFPHQFE